MQKISELSKGQHNMEYLVENFKGDNIKENDLTENLRMFYKIYSEYYGKYLHNSTTYQEILTIASNKVNQFLSWKSLPTKAFAWTIS